MPLDVWSRREIIHVGATWAIAAVLTYYYSYIIPRPQEFSMLRVPRRGLYDIMRWKARRVYIPRIWERIYPWRLKTRALYRMASQRSERAHFSARVFFHPSSLSPVNSNFPSLFFLSSHLFVRACIYLRPKRHKSRFAFVYRFLFIFIFYEKSPFGITILRGAMSARYCAAEIELARHKRLV